MDYRGKKIAITGWKGFIGAALVKRLESLGAQVVKIHGDVRLRETFDQVNYSYDYLFHFGSPSSQVMFKRNPAYCIETTMLGIINAADVAKTHGVRLVYPSTGLLSSDRYNEYAMGKKMSEDYVKGLKMDAVGVRIFATYGPGEGHKRDYASVPYLFARDILSAIPFDVYGDGEQKRDFIYIDDTVNGILGIAERASEDIVDLGYTKSHSFNDVIDNIGKATNAPRLFNRVDKPVGYVDETHAKSNKYYQPRITLQEGILMMIKEMEQE